MPVHAEKTLSSVGEFGLIELISRQNACERPDVERAIGDDAAVIAARAAGRFLVTADVLNESVHFTRATITPYRLGRKSLAVNLSDIAAMGGRPLYYLVCLSLPPDMSLDYVRALYRGMQAQARRFNVALLGGDTAAAAGGLSIAVTLIGSAHSQRVLYRCGARCGDLVFVSGTPGDAALGLALLKQGVRVSGDNYLVRRHQDPEPRVDLGRRLAEQRIATSMIDLSDGIAADLDHVLRMSGVGAELYLDRLPLSRAYRRQCARLSADFYAPALCGGEDYELLFTAAPGRRAAVEACARTLGTAVTCIGCITEPGDRLRIIDAAGCEYVPNEKGFHHF